MNQPAQNSEIDFLPQKYREQGKRRQRKMSRYLVVVVFGAVLLMATVWQLQLKRSVQGSLDGIRPQVAATQTQQALLSHANEQLAAAEAKAKLYAFLEHPWPTTQILAAVLRDLPPEMHLVELQLQSEQAERAGLNQFAERRPGGEQEQTTEIVPPPTEDLRLLKSKAESSRLVVRMEGISINTGRLYGYLDKVSRSALIERAELESLEAEESRQSSARTAASSTSSIGATHARFRVKLTVVNSLTLTQAASAETPAEQPDLAVRSDR